MYDHMRRQYCENTHRYCRIVAEVYDIQHHKMAASSFPVCARGQG